MVSRSVHNWVEAVNRLALGSEANAAELEVRSALRDARALVFPGVADASA